MTDRLDIIPTGPGMGRGLVWHDDASKQFRAIDGTYPTQPRIKSWRRGAAYNQGETSQCVAYTGKGILNSQALSVGVAYRTRNTIDPADLYAGAQDNDQWPGAQYDGTSSLGLCRYLLAVGLIREYRWCFGIKDVLLALSYVGPVGLGVRWRADMWNTDHAGYIYASGDAAGGHEIEITAIDPRGEGRVIVTNSWGTNWGVNGRAYLRFADLDNLLRDNGDAFVLVT